MGEEREDPQQLKRAAAAAAYDYENDPRWVDYWSNILIPPHMSSRSDVVDHFKRKFYQRFIDPELMVDVMSSSSSAQPNRPSASSRTTNDQTQPRSAEEMGEEREDPQQLKRAAAAAAYDYENDPRWADYWSNILIPPHMSSRSDVVDHFKRKFYQRFIDPELMVDVMSSSSSAQPNRPSASSRTTNDQTQPRSAEEMGEEREDPQQLKRAAAAAAYDYENDPRWADYWSNILIPPHMSSRSDVVDHFKRKFYQRFIDPELMVDVMSSSSSAQPNRPSASSRTTNDQTQPRSAEEMGEEREDPQQLKRAAAAAAYDYENDPRWADYWSNILIPPHMSSRSDVVDHFKRKFYQRFIDPELMVDVMSSSSSAQPNRPSASSRTTNDQTQPRSAEEMGEEREDPQQLKRAAAAAAYDYENDPRWADYWSNILIPPHMSSRSDVVDHFKRKFYQRFIDPELMVDVMSSSSSAQPNRPSASSRTTNDQTQPRSAEEMGEEREDPQQLKRAAAAAAYDYENDPRWADYWSNILIPPHMSSRSDVVDHFKRKFYQRFIVRTVLTHECNFKVNIWLKYLEGPCVWVESNTTTLSILSSHAEIGVGFLLIISLFSWQRNIVQAFMYWQLLKLMYHAPVTANYHLSVWTKIGRTVHPLIHRYTPFLGTPLSAVQRWWLR